MVPFLATGAVIGLVLGLVLAVIGPDAPNASPGQEVLALAVPGGLFGGLIGGILYLVAERFSGRG